MIWPTLLLVVLAPQQGRGPFPASRWLPEDRTLLAVELARPASLLAQGSHVWQLSAFRTQRVPTFLAWLAQRDRWFKVLHAHRAEVCRFIEAFDRGITAATIFTESRWKRPRPLTYVIGAASDAHRTRHLGASLRKLFENPDPSARELWSKETPLEDSPVQVLTLGRGHGQVAGSYRRHQALHFANRGRSAAFLLENTWSDGNEEKNERAERAVRRTLGGLIGVGPRSGGGARLVRRPATPAEPLARFVFRFHRCASHETFGMSDRERDEATRFGFWGFAGAQSTLWVEDGEVRDRVEIHHAKTEGDSFFAIFREGKHGLGDVAAMIPAHALAAARVACHAGRAVRWAETFAPELGLDPAAAIAQLRGLLGLAGEGEEADLAGLDSLAAFIVPPAAGSPLPEVALLLHVPPRDGQIDALLGAWGTLCARLVGGQPPALKTLGKGDDAIRYLPLKQLLLNASRNDEGARFVASLLGGGFVSAARYGDSLVIGMNPRTLRAAIRSIRAGETLATRPGFRARFPAGSGRALEGWFDFPAITARLGAIENMFPILVTSLLDSVSTSFAPFPRAEDLARHMREEFIWSERTEFGHVLHLRGGTMLSPTAWAASVYGIYVTDMLCRMLH